MIGTVYVFGVPLGQARVFVAATDKNYALMAEAWIQAREWSKATDVLAKGCDLAAVSRSCGVEHSVAQSLDDIAALTRETGRVSNEERGIGVAPFRIARRNRRVREWAAG